MSIRVVSWISDATSAAFSMVLYFFSRYIAMVGVFGLLLASNISTNLGKPNVTLISDAPARWYVLMVICVAGSDMLCAATTPIASPHS